MITELFRVTNILFLPKYEMSPFYSHLHNLFPPFLQVINFGGKNNRLNMVKGNIESIQDRMQTCWKSG
jgi:hypothetical protein